MTGLPRHFLRQFLRPSRLRLTGWGGQRWFAQQSSGQVLQPRLPRLPLAAWSRPQSVAIVGQASCFFSTSRRCSRYNGNDDELFDPAELEDLWGPGPEDPDNPKDWRLPYPNLVPVLRLPEKAPSSPLVQYLTPPLNILFCGSDAFSCPSLQALYDEMLRQQIEDVYQPPPPQGIPRPGRIASIDVVVRPAKPRGRGLTAQPSPVQKLAEQLKLPIHTVDSFTDWTPPPCNLIIAVSFGLFVPARMLRDAAYGGINIHPSFLPDLHGATPIPHAFLLGRRFTGVTVQTLDETKFDGGRVLRVSQPVELVSRSAGAASPTAVANAADLHNVLAPLGARMLLQTLRLGLYVHEALRRRINDIGPERAMISERKSLALYESRIRERVLPVKEMQPTWPVSRYRKSKTQYTHNVVGVAAAAAIEGDAPVTVFAGDIGSKDALHPRMTVRATPAAAPKLTKADFEVPWLPLQSVKDIKRHMEQKLPTNQFPQTTAIDIDRRGRALGGIWTHVIRPPDLVKASLKKMEPRRVLFYDVDVVACPPALQAVLAAAPNALGTAYQNTVTDSADTAGAAKESRESDLLNVRIVTFEQTIPLSHEEQVIALREQIQVPKTGIKDGEGKPDEGQDPAKPAPTPLGVRLTLPYVVDTTDDSGAILLPIGVPPQHAAAKSTLCCVRIGKIVLAGGTLKPAATTIGPFARGLGQMEEDERKAALNEVSWDVVFRRLDSKRLDSKRLDSKRQDSKRLDSKRLDSKRLDTKRKR